MRGSNEDLPVMVDDSNVRAQMGEWGGMTVSIMECRQEIDNAPLLKGAPNDQCQCPHWGYIIKGRMVANYGDSQEVYNAGDAYYIPPGHTVLADEGTETVEFSPSEQLQKTMEVIMRNYQQIQAGQ